MSNPSEALAAHIVDRLVAEGLMLAKDAKSALPKFANGKLTAEDWRLLIENASVAKGREVSP